MAGSKKAAASVFSIPKTLIAPIPELKILSQKLGILNQK
jgi:hypothetical protein